MPWRLLAAFLCLMVLQGMVPATAQSSGSLKAIPVRHIYQTAGDVFVNGVRYRTPATAMVDVSQPVTVEVEALAMAGPGRRNEYQQMSIRFGEGSSSEIWDDYGVNTTRVTIADARNLTSIYASWRQEIQVLFRAEGPGKVAVSGNPEDYYFPGQRISFSAVPNPGAVFNGWKLPHPFESGGPFIEHKFYEPTVVTGMFSFPGTAPPPLNVEGALPRFRYRSSNNVLQGAVRFTSPGKVYPRDLWVGCLGTAIGFQVTHSNLETPLDVSIRIEPYIIDANHVPNGEYRCALGVYRNDGGADLELPFVVFLGEEAPDPNPEPTNAVVDGVVDGASFRPVSLAPGAIFSLFGQRLAASAMHASSLPLPSVLGGTEVRITVGGQTRIAPLFYVSPNQVNFLVPLDLPRGGGFVEVVRDGSGGTPRSIVVESLAPALFTANASGTGVPAGYSMIVRGGMQERRDIAVCAENTPCTPAPLVRPQPDGDLFLILFGTGFRNSANPRPEAVVGNQVMQVEFAGPHPDFAGLDQINVKIPQALVGTGLRELKLRHGGKETNNVAIHF